jgi:hypothetical protein
VLANNIIIDAGGDIILSSVYGYVIATTSSPNKEKAKDNGVQIMETTKEGIPTGNIFNVFYMKSRFNPYKETFIVPGSVLGTVTGTKDLYGDKNVPNHIHDERVDTKNTYGLSLDNPFEYTNPNRQYNGDSKDRTNYATSYFDIDKVFTKKGFVSLNPITRPFPKVEKPKLDITIGIPKE